MQDTFKGIFDLGSEFPLNGSHLESSPAGRRDARSRSIGIVGTPGHTPACVSFAIEDAVFVGDALFIEELLGTGRCDSPRQRERPLPLGARSPLRAPQRHARLRRTRLPAGRPELRFETTVPGSLEAEQHPAARHDEGVHDASPGSRRNACAAGALLFQSVQVNVQAGRLPPGLMPMAAATSRPRSTSSVRPTTSARRLRPGRVNTLKRGFSSASRVEPLARERERDDGEGSHAQGGSCGADQSGGRGGLRGGHGAGRRPRVVLATPMAETLLGFEVPLGAIAPRRLICGESTDRPMAEALAAGRAARAAAVSHPRRSTTSIGRSALWLPFPLGPGRHARGLAAPLPRRRSVPRPKGRSSCWASGPRTWR